MLDFNVRNELQKQFSVESSSVLLDIKRGDKNFYSSAVAISGSMLLTSAHSVDCLDTGIAIADGIKIEIEHVYIHPSYNPQSSFFDHDIAVIKLKKRLPFGIVPAIIGKDDFVVPGPYQRIGYGERNGHNFKFVSNIKFLSRTFNQRNLLFIDSTSVNGDSGGPIYKMTEKGLKLIAIHSTLENDNKIYTVNLSEYRSWIDSKIEEFLLVS